MSSPNPSNARGVPPRITEPLLAEIDAALASLSASDAVSSGPRWGAMHKVLLKAKVDPKAIMPLVASRDLAGMRALVGWLHGEVVEPPRETAPSLPPVDPEVMRAAIKAFRKRLRLARLDSESRLGVGPMSTGKRHEIDAIIPPRDFSVGVWEALVAAGRLRREGGGFYALTHDDLDDE